MRGRERKRKKTHIKQNENEKALGAFGESIDKKK